MNLKKYCIHVHVCNSNQNRFQLEFYADRFLAVFKLDKRLYMYKKDT